MPRRLGPDEARIFFVAPAAIRERVEIARLAAHRDRPTQAPTMQEFLVALLDRVLPPLPTVPAATSEDQVELDLAPTPRRARHAGGARRRTGAR